MSHSTNTTSLFSAAATAALTLVLACSSPSSAPKPDGATDAIGGGFTAAGCKADTCGAEAAKCGWGTSDPKYLQCLSDCDMLATIVGSCPNEVEALYACAALGAKVDCTTGKGTGCSSEERRVAACVLGADAGP